MEGCELNTLAGMRQVVERLAAYEDTGLEPGEIDSGFINSVIEENKRLKAELSNLQDQPNPPLTLEELREMDGEPVYLRHDDLGFLNGWKVVDCAGEIRIHFTDRCSVLTQEYGVCLRAYRRKPEEGET